MQVDRRPRGRFLAGLRPVAEEKMGRDGVPARHLPDRRLRQDGRRRTVPRTSRRQPGEFYSKSVGQRSIVFVAGVFMNLVFGFIAFMLAYQIGVPVQPAIVGGVQPGSPAWNVGLKRGDVIEAIRGVSPPIDFEDLSATITLTTRGEGSPPERQPRRPAIRRGRLSRNTTRPAACPAPASCRRTRSRSPKSRRRGTARTRRMRTWTASSRRG